MTQPKIVKVTARKLRMGKFKVLKNLPSKVGCYGNIKFHKQYQRKAAKFGGVCLHDKKVTIVLI